MKKEIVIITSIVGVGCLLGIYKVYLNLKEKNKKINQLLNQISNKDSSLGKFTNSSELHDELVDLIKDIKLNPKKYVGVDIYLFGKKRI